MGEGQYKCTQMSISHMVNLQMCYQKKEFCLRGSSQNTCVLHKNCNSEFLHPSPYAKISLVEDTFNERALISYSFISGFNCVACNVGKSQIECQAVNTCKPVLTKLNKSELFIFVVSLVLLGIQVCTAPHQVLQYRQMIQWR